MSVNLFTKGRISSSGRSLGVSMFTKGRLAPLAAVALTFIGGNLTPELIFLEHLSANIEAMRGAMHGFDLDTSGDWLPIKVDPEGKLEVGP